MEGEHKRLLSTMLAAQGPIALRKSTVCQEYRTVELLRDLSRTKRDKMFLLGVYHAATQAMIRLRAAIEIATINHYLYHSLVESSSQDWLQMSEELSSITRSFTEHVAKEEEQWCIRSNLENQVAENILVSGKF